MTHCVIGVDLGTTSVKANLFHENGQMLQLFSHTVKTHHEEDGSAKQCPQEVARATGKVLVEAAQFAKKSGFSVRLVGISAAMHSLLVVNQAGEPLTYASIWMDARPNEEAMQLRRQPIGKTLYEATGTPLHAMSPLAKLLWMRRQSSPFLNQHNRYVSLKEFVWYQWFGEWVVDESMAGASGMYNLHIRDWDPLALSLAGIQRDQLSSIVPTKKLYQGVINSELKLAGLSDTLFNIGASDGVLANLGVGALDEESMVITMGTSCAVRLTAHKPIFDFQHQPFTYVLDDERYVVGGPSNSGGVIVDWILQQFLGSSVSEDNDMWKILLQEASQVDSGNLTFLPYVAGERAPLWNADWSGAWLGLRLEHQRSHLLRAALEGIVFNAFWIAGGLRKAGAQPKRLILSGKLLQNAFMSQLCADIFQLPVISCHVGDASARGAAKLAMLAAGDIQYHQISEGLPFEFTFPNKKKQVEYAEKYERFRSYCQLLESNLSASSSRV